MKAVWLVRWHELSGRIRFWTAIVGYDPRDRSLKQAIYLLYVVIFFGVWGFSILLLLASVGVEILSWFSELMPALAAVLIMAATLIISGAFRGYKSGVGSPYIFSEADAELICQTPVDRRQVAFAWCLQDWFLGSVLYAAIAVVLSFANQQLLSQGEFTWRSLPIFFLAGIRAASIVIPLEITILTLCYALGALRLWDDLDNKWLRWIPVGLVIVMAMIGLSSLSPSQITLWPVFVPLQAAYGVVNWLPGFVVSVLSASLSLLILYWATARLNLSRAAQESRNRRFINQAAWLMDPGLSQEIKTRQKLGLGHEATRITGMAGISSIIWKHRVAATRVVNIDNIVRWLGILALCITMLIAPDSGNKLWAFIFWSLLIARQGIAKLRPDLRVWTLTRQLPFTAREFVVVECMPPALIASFLSWLAIGMVFYLGFRPQIYLIFLLPVAILCIVFSAAFDVLRQCRSNQLLDGWIANIGPLGLLLGLIFAGIPIFLVSMLNALYPAVGLVVLFVVLGLAICAGSAYGFWRLAAFRYIKLK